MITAMDRKDGAFALGFVHAQERFFQMDLHRRSSAGELAALLGPTSITADKRARIHQFRCRAATLLRGLPAGRRLLLEAYCDGVNAGLKVLRAAPFEYALLDLPGPVAWRIEDCLLVVFDMYCSLQDDRGEQDFHRHLLYTRLPGTVADFLAAEGSPDDRPMVGEAPSAPEIPAREQLDFRGMNIPRVQNFRIDHSPSAGSNVWAVSGRFTRDGQAIVANDVHLPFTMPNRFFQAELATRGERLAGMTLPGLPFFLSGTNGKLAWGIANAAIDAVDLVALDQAGLNAGQYRSSWGVEKIVEETETIEVRGAPAEVLKVRKAAWGPIVRTARDGTLFAQQWVAHRDEAVNLSWFDLEEAATIEEAIVIANRAGTPALATVFADRSGDIGWTIAGPLHAPSGSDHGPALSSARLPPLPREIVGPEEHPRLTGHDRLWAANARCITSGKSGEMLGGGFHINGARAAQIGKALADLAVADEDAMRAIQLDHRAMWLRPWQPLLLEALAGFESGSRIRADALARVVNAWEGSAASNCAAYRAIRKFHDTVERMVFEPFVSLVRAGTEPFDLGKVTDHLSAPLRELLTRRPLHLLPPWFDDWPALLRAAAEEVLERIDMVGGLSRYTWGQRNGLRMRHPLQAGASRLGISLEPPSVPLDGDFHMPLAQSPEHGAVFRLVMTPGSIGSTVQMVGGQAANPFAPYYLARHDAWCASEAAPSPSLGERPRFLLTLAPSGRAVAERATDPNLRRP